MAAEANGCIQERSAKEENDKAQAGVVIAAEGVGPLKLSDCGIQLGGVVCQCLALCRLQAGGIDRVQQRSA
jgi:hypothetical protein